tara:strand:- start:625 stop:1176 length:552 start_codon:yes stop_codon:yes gene_type:complete
MDKQKLHIVDFPILYEILYELKHIHNFDLEKVSVHSVNKKKFTKFDLVISRNLLSIEDQIELKNLPIELDKLLDVINLKFLKKKIEFKKNIKLGKYLINFNTRKIIYKNKILTLTEKEAKIIDFLNNSNDAVTVQLLQKNVWGHKSKLDTHTVETHIYRLRKKILTIFNDNNFIKSKKSGYYI